MDHEWPMNKSKEEKANKDDPSKPKKALQNADGATAKKVIVHWSLVGLDLADFLNPCG